MKNRMQHVRMATLTGLMVVVLMVMAGTSFAGSIIAVHGTSGDIEYMDRVSKVPTGKRSAGALISNKNQEITTGYTTPFPPSPLTKTRYLLVYYETGIHRRNGRFVQSTNFMCTMVKQKSMNKLH